MLHCWALVVLSVSACTELMGGPGAALGAAGRELHIEPLLSSGPARVSGSTRLRDGRSFACRTSHICQRVGCTWAGGEEEFLLHWGTARAAASGGAACSGGAPAEAAGERLGAAPGMVRRPARRPGPSLVSAPAPDRARRRPRTHGCSSQRCPAPPSPLIIAEEAP